MFTRAIKGKAGASTRSARKAAQEIVEDLEAALEQFREIASDLGGGVVETKKE